VVLRCLRLLVVGSLTAGFLLLLPQTSTAAPSLRLSRTSVIVGETVTISGTVGGTRVRPVQLLRRYQGVWVRVTTARTSRKGAFEFHYRPPTSAQSRIDVKVQAPAAKVGGRRLKSVVTSTRAISTVVPTARIEAPASTTSAAPLEVRGTFAPARPGRVTEVQRWDGRTWARVADGSQDRTGATTFSIGLVEPGTSTLRVRTLAAAGAPETASTVHPITVTEPVTDPDPDPDPDPGPDPGPTGVTAVAGDATVLVTWDPLSADDLEGYLVYTAASLAGPWALLTPDPLGPEHEATFTADGLTNGTTYAFAVTSVRTSGAESARSLSELVAPAAADPPPAPNDPDPPPALDCGTAPPKVDGSPWQCTLAEEFDGSTFDRTRWYPQQAFATGTPDAMACYRNTPETIAIGDGVLSLSVVKVAEPVSCSFGKLSGSTDMIAGSLMSYQRFTQQYGRFEARIKSQQTSLPGLQEAFWMWPDDRVPSPDKWPVAGEIDVSETYSRTPSLSIPFLHYRADTEGPLGGVNTAYCAAERGAWNTYTLVWTPDRIEILVNDRTCLVNTSGDSAFKKPYLILLTAMLGVGNNAYDGRVPLPATMQVDYVRAWK
jgi:beta-glucanase (GH16 family)